MANQILLDRALDANGNIMPGAKATVYADGTSTLISVFSDVDGTIPAANPIVADGNGIWPQRFVNETARVAVTDASGVAIYTMDPAPTAQGAGAAASAISFNPTIDLPFTNVQSAIEGAAAFATSGFTAFGIGITGNATLLANIDATTLGGGVYRFDGTTTGTFPSGVAAADGGLVETWRQTSGVAMQMLYHATTDRAFHRRMSASVWGAWREALTVNQGAAEGDVIYRGASAWTRLAKGTAGQVLRMNTGATAPEWGAIWSETSVITLSGASTDISTAIPAGVKRIRVWVNGVSMDGASGYNQLQVGTGGSFVTTGYTRAASSHEGSSISSTSGFITMASNNQNPNAGMAGNVAYDLRLIDAATNTWMCAHTGSNSGNLGFSGNGTIALAGALDRLRMITTGSGGNFDAGTVFAEWGF